MRRRKYFSLDEEEVSEEPEDLKVKVINESSQTFNSFQYIHYNDKVDFQTIKPAQLCCSSFILMILWILFTYISVWIIYSIIFGDCYSDDICTSQEIYINGSLSRCFNSNPTFCSCFQGSIYHNNSALGDTETCVSGYDFYSLGFTFGFPVGFYPFLTYSAAFWFFLSYILSLDVCASRWGHPSRRVLLRCLIIGFCFSFITFFIFAVKMNNSCALDSSDPNYKCCSFCQAQTYEDCENAFSDQGCKCKVMNFLLEGDGRNGDLMCVPEGSTSAPSRGVYHVYVPVITVFSAFLILLCIVKRSALNDINAISKTEGTTRLHEAKTGEEAADLLRRGANPNARQRVVTRDKISATELARRNAQANTPFMTSVEQQNVDVLRVLLSDRRTDTTVTFKGWSTGIYFAALKGYVEVLALLLEEPRSNPNVKFQGFTPLYVASNKGHTEALAMLLRDGRADPNAGPPGWSPLVTAASNGHIDCVKQLLCDERVDPNHNEVEVLFEALSRGHLDVVKLLLDNPRIQLQGIMNKFIYQATCRDYADIVEPLLQSEFADPNALQLIGNFLMTPLFAASVKGHTTTIKVLLNDARIDPNIGRNPSEDNHLDQTSVTPLLAAVEYGHLEAVRLLLSHKSTDPNISYQDKTPIQHIVLNEHVCRGTINTKVEILGLLLNCSRINLPTDDDFTRYISLMKQRASEELDKMHENNNNNDNNEAGNEEEESALLIHPEHSQSQNGKTCLQLVQTSSLLYFLTMPLHYAMLLFLFYPVGAYSEYPLLYAALDATIWIAFMSITFWVALFYTMNNEKYARQTPRRYLITLGLYWLSLILVFHALEYVLVLTLRMLTYTEYPVFLLLSWASAPPLLLCCLYGIVGVTHYCAYLVFSFCLAVLFNRRYKFGCMFFVSIFIFFYFLESCILGWAISFTVKYTGDQYAIIEHVWEYLLLPLLAGFDWFPVAGAIFLFILIIFGLIGRIYQAICACFGCLPETSVFN